VTYDSTQPLLPQLRLAEQTERDELVRFKLRAASEGLEGALSALQRHPTGDHLTELVGLFASGRRLLNQAGSSAPWMPPEGPRPRHPLLDVPS
jgi:hypothetical protein